MTILIFEKQCTKIEKNCRGKKMFTLFREIGRHGSSPGYRVDTSGNSQSRRVAVSRADRCRTTTSCQNLRQNTHKKKKTIQISHNYNSRRNYYTSIDRHVHTRVRLIIKVD